jgi:F-type H+-transporting ATPase subunit epsilon
MAKLQVELLTAEGSVLSHEADFVRAPGLAGELGVLPRHIPLLTPLKTGEVMVRNEGHEEFLFVAGGFLEVLPDKVVILADVAERAEDIDEARAQEAHRRAQELLAESPRDAAVITMHENALMRLRVAELRRHRHPSRSGNPLDQG